MTMRARRPTDETGTEVYDPERQQVLPAAPVDAAAVAVGPAGVVGVGAVGVGAAESWDQDATEVTPRPGPTPTPTPTPTPVEPIRAISMKDRAEAGPRTDAARVPLHVQLRSMAEVAGRGEPRAGLGHFAPPRDALQARRRRRRDNVVWACVAIVLACAISLGIWLIAGR